MLTLTEWLNRVGFQGRNPFALKQAEEEGDLLQTYFVEHPAFNTMLDFNPPRSSILHAPRGAGKSSSRRMFEDYCAGHAAELQPLLVRLVDWMSLVERVGMLNSIQVRDHIDEIFCQVVRALAQDTRATWRTRPHDPDMAAYLNWMCLSHDRYLSPAQRELLEQHGLITETDLARLAPYRMEQMRALQRLELLVGVLRASGYQTCFVLIDRIDELVETAADWEIGADMLVPLIGNLPLNQIPGLAFRYFIPTEIVGVLRRRNLLREDRLRSTELNWGGQTGHTLLRMLLQNRLSVFSKDQIHSLAAIAAPDLRDIDDILLAAAARSPRRLLNLGDALFQICASAADTNDLLIEQEHLETVLSEYGIERPLHPLATAEVVAEQQVATVLGDQPVAVPFAGSAAPIPPLRVGDDGRIWRGSVLIDGWQRLPALQRKLLEYLYAHRGTLCPKSKLLDYVWEDREKPSDEDSLHKLAARLIKFIEPDPHHPVYIQRIYGGFYLLANAADDPLLDPGSASAEYP